MISDEIKENKLLLVSGIALLFYFFVKMIDCVYIIFIAIDLVPYLYSLLD